MHCKGIYIFYIGANKIALLFILINNDLSIKILYRHIAVISMLSID
jgi:hypothetical protein